MCSLAMNFLVTAQVGPPLAANPNTNNGYGFTQSSGTYTPLSASRTIWQSGATIGTNAVSTAITIPSFKFNGKTYTSLFISNNGFVTFGSPALAATTTGLSTNSAVPNLAEGSVAGFAVDLINANTATSEIAYDIVGSKFIVQFTDLKVSGGSAAQLLNFQIQLDSSNNSVSIVYGNCVSGTATVTGQVGLRGADGQGDVNNRTGTDWTATTPGTTNTSSCTLGITNAATVPANGLTFTYTPGTWIVAPTSYASLPFNEDFSTWANGNSTSDLPNATYWRTWPSRGNGSWRQNDIVTASTGYTSTSGWNNNTESSTTTIAAPAVAPTARFHSYFANAGIVGNMDLYVNLSSGGAGVRVLSFDYRNVSGSDKLEVFYSIDGGTTFTSAGTVTTNTTWTRPYFIINSNAAAAIVRLSATADYGSDDIFVDNLNLSVLTTAPQCTTITAPTNASTGASLTPTITWNSVTGTASYILNIGTTPGGTDVMNGVNVGNVTSYTIPTASALLYGKIYYVKVLPSNANGTATGCTEISFTTKNISCPSVSAPASAATGVSTSPTFTWTAVTDATGYKLTIGTTPGGTNILNAFDVGNVTTYALPTSLALGTKYYYTINAYNSYNSSASCTERNFTTAGCATVSVPASAATGVSTTPTFTWSAVTGATGYKLTIGTTSGGNNVLNAFDLGNVTSYALPTSLALGTKYYYTLNSYDATNTTTGCSERTFTTLTVCPTVSAPAANATGVSTTPTITWATATGAIGYKLTVGTTSGGTDVMNAVDVGNVLTYTFPAPLNNGVKYYYTVSGYDATSTSLGCSERNFTTVVTCFAPTALTVNTASITTSGAIVSWTAPSTVPSNGYEVYYSTSSTAPVFGTVLNGTNSVVSPTASAQINGLLPSTVYYVWARSVCNGPDRSSWTSVASFITLCQPPALLSNTGATVCPNNTATLSVTADAGATVTWYDALTAGTVLATGNSYTTPPLTATTTYYVEASNITNSTGQGRPTYTALASTSPSDYGLVFDVTKPFTLNSVKVYLVENPTTNLVINLTNSSGTVISTKTILAANLPSGGTSSAPVSYTVLLGWNMNIGTGYRLMANSGPTMVRESSIGGYPYALGTVGNITSGYISGTSTTYYYFYSWDVTSVCTSSPRQAVVATVSSAGCLGTSETTAKEGIQVYPNPFADVLNISDVNNVKSISVVDVAGRLVKTFDKPSSTLHLGELNSGMYLVVLNMKDGSKQTIKAIKK